jgi:hypothetical protein
MHQYLVLSWVHSIGLINRGIDTGLNIVSDYKACLSYYIADSSRLHSKCNSILPVAAGKEA